MTVQGCCSVKVIKISLHESAAVVECECYSSNILVECLVT